MRRRRNGHANGRCSSRRCGSGHRAEGSRQEKSKKEAKEAAAPAAPSGPATYPNAVDSKYSKETATKQRFQTCLDQYNANKAGNANGGLKWIQKGGGYYSECNKKLKGAA